MSGDRVVTGIIVNNSSTQMVFELENIIWGEWVDSPPPFIPANGGTGTFIARGADGSATGTQGTVQYQMGDQGPTITMSFSDPFVAKDAFSSSSSSSEFTVGNDSPTGNTPTVTYTVASASAAARTPPR